jgi:MFS family permease
LVITQWVSSAFGGYLTGRLRTKWVGIRTDEIFFRDTAHGFLAWALAAVLMAALFSLVSAAMVAGASAGADTTVTAEAADQARKAAASFSLFTSVSFLIGAFIASVAGALGGYHRDEV